MTLLYAQLLLGTATFARPPPLPAGGRKRVAWEWAHVGLGRAAILVGAVNVASGVVILCERFRIGKTEEWGGWVAAGILLGSFAGSMARKAGEHRRELRLTKTEKTGGADQTQSPLPVGEH